LGMGQRILTRSRLVCAFLSPQINGTFIESVYEGASFGS
jgi:hypothetical protein